ncbi:MAG: hypothetical protein ABIP77_10355, partial [Candidatus Limnocylindrales bacterium]
MEERNLRLGRTTGFLAAIAIMAAACGGGGNSAGPGESTGNASPPPASTGAGSAEPSAAAGGFTCADIGGEVSVYGTWTG